MYNMISLTLTGTEQYMSHLRLLTAYSLITHREHMSEVIQPTARILLPLMDEVQLQFLRKQKFSGWTSFAVHYKMDPGGINFIYMPSLLLWRGQFPCMELCVTERFNIKAGSCNALM